MPTQNTPTDTHIVHVIAARLDSMHADMQEMKTAHREMASAFSKLVLIEERQTTTFNTLERVFKSMEKLEQKIDYGFKDAKRSDDALEERIDTLEKAAPMQAQTSQWVIAAVWAAAGLAAFAVAKQAGLL